MFHTDNFYSKHSSGHVEEKHIENFSTKVEKMSKDVRKLKNKLTFSQLNFPQNVDFARRMQFC